MTSLRTFNSTNLEQIPQVLSLSQEERLSIKTVAEILPFRVNNYVVNELIDWNNIPNDPIFRLTFPQREMLKTEHFEQMRALIVKEASTAEKRVLAAKIQASLNPNPAGQKTHNIPELEGSAVQGMQHKYRETVLFFPSQGQTCHAYCAYCFRWSQFVGIKDIKFASNDIDRLIAYLCAHPEVTDVIFTGGDPMVMKCRVLEKYIKPLLELENLKTIRIGTKSLAWWPYRFTTDKDSDDLMRLFETVVASGKHLAIMAHSSHPRELQPKVLEQAVKRIRATGAIIRTQAPIIRYVNDCSKVWESLWQRQVELGMIPYYMFMERDTGAKNYFKLPLATALKVFQQAYSGLSGIARTVRGPSMSCIPGKILVDGIVEIGGKPLFVLKFLQARKQAWSNRVFFAEFDEEACWMDDLRPAFGAKEFFFNT